MGSFKSYAFASAACAVFGLLVAACNYTDGTCYPRGEGGGATDGAGGGVIVPGTGGFGDVPPKPQGAGDNGADPCNVVEGKVYYCSGVVNCSKAGDFSGGLAQCPYWNHKQSASAPGEALEIVIRECQDSHAGYSCSQHTLQCDDKPRQGAATASKYVCNGGVTCTDSKKQMDGCTFTSEEVYADDESDAIDLLVETCEINMHDKYGDNCDHGGMCCTAGSLTCHKS